MRQQELEARTRERFEQELEVARLIQQNFLPRELPDLPGWDVAAYYRPAREVGGDFYDVIPLRDGQVGFVVGDVTDKGVPAALVMAATRSVLRASAQRLVDPGVVLERVNEHLCPDMPAKMFVTCLYGVLEPATGRLRFANAGHDLPYVKTADGVVELRARGMPLGLMPGMDYEEKEAVLAPGDSVLLHSDGIVEAHAPDRDMFGFPRLKDAVGRHPGGGELIDRVLEELGALHRPRRRAGGRHHDGRPCSAPRAPRTRPTARCRSACSPSSSSRAGPATSARRSTACARRSPRWGSAATASSASARPWARPR